MLAARNLRVLRGGQSALDGVDIRIRPGAMTAVVGPNGAGKSTLIAALTGVVRLETGAATLDGADVGRMGARALARRVAVLRQDARSIFAFKAFEIVAMGRSAHRGFEAAAETARLTEQALIATEVAHLADRPVDSLSGGERQRVFLARALAQILPLPADPPRYLLLDEPTASLDLRHQATALGFARATARAGAGVAVVLHDLNLAARFADDVVILSGGVVAAYGRPADIFVERVLTRVYGAGLSIFAEPGGGAPVVLPAMPGQGQTSAPGVGP